MFFPRLFLCCSAILLDSARWLFSFLVPDEDQQATLETEPLSAQEVKDEQEVRVEKNSGFLQQRTRVHVATVERGWDRGPLG